MHIKNPVYPAMVIIFLIGTAAISKESLAEELVRSGKVICGVAPFFRSGANEYHDNSIVLRNVNDARTITIDRVQAWDHYGELHWDSSDHGFPRNQAFTPKIEAHQGSRFFASEVFRGTLPVTGNLGQVAIEYSLDRPGYRLGAVSTHFAREGDLSGAERSRQIFECRKL